MVLRAQVGELAFLSMSNVMVLPCPILVVSDGLYAVHLRLRAADPLHMTHVWIPREADTYILKRVLSSY